MKKSILGIIIVIIIVLISIGIYYYTQNMSTTESSNISSNTVEEPNVTSGNISENAAELEVGTNEQRGFIIDNVLHSEEQGDIHFASYFPEGYNETDQYAIYFALPGWEGLYFQGVGANMNEPFPYEAQQYNKDMIIISLQLDDWGGETLSIVLGKRPELFTSALFVSSQWDGDLEVLANARTPLYIAIGENDSYYGSQKAKNAYNSLHKLYEEQGLSDEQIADILVLDVKNHDYFTSQGMQDEHAGLGLFAYDENIMNWFFSKSK